jgi:hypothetical protein
MWFRLPHVPRPRMSVCILADAADIDRAKLISLEVSRAIVIAKRMYVYMKLDSRVRRHST